MIKKTTNNFANEDALEGFNLQRLQMQGPEEHGRLSETLALRDGCTGRQKTRDLSALSIKNRHRIPDTTANYSKSNIQHPTSRIPNLLPLHPVWKVAVPVLKLGRTLSFLAILAASVGVVLGQTFNTWNSTSSNSWGGGANWVNGVPNASSEVAQFGSVSNTGSAPANTIGIVVGIATVGAIEMTSARLNSMTLGSSSSSAVDQPLSISGATIDSIANIIISNNSSYNFTINQKTTGTNTLSIGLGNSTNNIIRVAGSGNITINATITGSNPLAINATGSGEVQFRGANTYTGNTTINNGNLTISGGSAIADTGTVTLANTAGVGFNVNSSETIASLQGGGATGGNVVIASAQTLTVAEANTNTFSGSLQGSGGLTKSGAGTLTLNGTNTNTGAVSATGGTLFFSGANALSSGVTSLSATNATLSLADSSARATALSGGSLSLTNGTFIFELGTTSDSLTLNGAATLSGTNTIRLLDLGGFAGGNLTLISATSGLNGGSWALNAASAPTGFSFSLNATATSLTLVATANSAFYYWKGANGSTWGTANNWTSDSAGTTLLAGAPSSTADVVFAATGATNLSNTLGADYTVSTVTLSTGGVTIAGANTLTANTTSALAFRDTASSGTNVISANLAGSGAGFTKSGAGTLTLSGANTFAGGVTLSAGTLNLNSATAPGSGTITISGGTIDNTSGSTVTLSNNNAQAWSGDFTFTGTNTLNLGTGAVALGASRTVSVSGGTLAVGGIISGAGYSLTKAGAGTLTLSGANTYTGGTTLSAGTLNINSASAIGSGTFTISGGTLNNTSGSSVTLSTNNAQNWNGDFAFTGTNDLNLGTGEVTMNANRIVTVNGGNLTVGGAISGTTASFTLIKAGAGTLILGGASAYTGATTVTAGTLQTSAADRINDYSAISVSAGAALVLGGNETVASIAGVGNYSLGANTLTFGDTSNQTVSGIISGTGGSLVKNGSGSITLSGNNTYSGGTTISAGTLQLGTNNALGSGSLKLGVTGTPVTITFISTDATDRTISNALTTIAGSSWNTTFGSAGTGNLTFGNSTSVSLVSTRTFTVNNSWTSFANAFTGASAGITKNGTGTLILAGNNTYAGATTINTGTLQLGSGGTTGLLNATSTITNNGTLVFNRSDTLTQGTHFSTAAIGGTGSVVQAGSGTLILNAANTYSGGTVLNTGTLRLSHTGAAGSGTITQSSGASLLHLNAAGTFANAMSVYNVQASETLTLSGGITVNNATFDVDNGDTLTISNTVNGTGGVTKNGTGALILSGSNSYTGATTINAGTLQAAAANALGSTTSVLVGNGGSLLVTEGNSINNTAGITLAGGTLALNGSFSESMGALTLSANSTIDLLGFNGTLTFAGLGFWTNNASLSITNWNGVNKYGTPVGSGVADRHVVFTNTSGLDSNLSRISFYSGSFGVGFAGTAYELGGGEIGVVPEPETIVTAFMLLVGSGLLWLRRRVAIEKKAGCQPWRQLISFKTPPSMQKTIINGVAFPKDQVPRIIKAITKVDVFSQKPPRNLEPGLMRLIQEVVFGSPGSEEACKGLLKNLHKSPEALKYLALLLAQRSSD